MSTTRWELLGTVLEAEYFQLGCYRHTQDQEEVEKRC